MNRLMTLADAAELIRSGAFLSLAGPESALDALPAGHWIAGTIPYFMDTAGGVVSTEGKVFVTPLPASGKITLAHYGVDQLRSVIGNGPDNGFTVAIVPAGSTAHKTFAQEAVNDADAFAIVPAGYCQSASDCRASQRVRIVFAIHQPCNPFGAQPFLCSFSQSGSAANNALRRDFGIA